MALVLCLPIDVPQEVDGVPVIAGLCDHVIVASGYYFLWACLTSHCVLVHRFIDYMLNESIAHVYTKTHAHVFTESETTLNM